ALITFGSAPLDWASFRAALLGQLGEARLQGAIDADIAGQNNHAQALDADTSGQLRDIHRRVATAILFESSGGQTDKSAHLPELRFALGEPNIETTSIDTAANQMEARGFFIRRKGTDGYQFGFKPTLKKVVNDRRASLDEDLGGSAVARTGMDGGRFAAADDLRVDAQPRKFSAPVSRLVDLVHSQTGA